MKIGLIGLNQTGKTTLFCLLTGRANSETTGSGRNTANVGTGTVPDERVDFLTQLYKPKKTTYAKIDLTDVAGFAVSENDRSGGASKFLNDVRNCDALVHVLRAFESDSVIHDSGTINPARDLEAVETEMLFADLEMIEKRIARIKDGKKVTKEHEAEIALLERCYDELENGGSILDMEMSESERISIRGFSFLTEKPRLVVLNVDEEQQTEKLQNATFQSLVNNLQELCNKLNIPLLSLCAQMEMEISNLPVGDRQVFMDDMGIKEPGVHVLARAVYELLSLISFLTVGEDEVRAWTIEKETVAQVAAGKIHTDIERGFIRAEVVKYKDIFELGTMVKVKEKGLFRLEGKQYVVEDGDIINFRFNV